MLISEFDLFWSVLTLLLTVFPPGTELFLMCHGHQELAGSLTKFCTIRYSTWLSEKGILPHFLPAPKLTLTWPRHWPQNGPTLPCELLTPCQGPGVDTEVTHPWDRHKAFFKEMVGNEESMIFPECSRSHPAISPFRHMSPLCKSPSGRQPVMLDAWDLRIPSCSHLKDGLSWILRSGETPVIFQPDMLHTNLPKSTPAWASPTPINKHA